jgi:hypothetical protein
MQKGRPAVASYQRRACKKKEPRKVNKVSFFGAWGF